LAGEHDLDYEGEIMQKKDDIANLSSDELWELRAAVVELLVGRITERSQELDDLLAELGVQSQPREQKAA